MCSWSFSKAHLNLLKAWFCLGQTYSLCLWGFMSALYCKINPPTYWGRNSFVLVGKELWLKLVSICVLYERGPAEHLGHSTVCYLLLYRHSWLSFISQIKGRKTLRTHKVHCRICSLEFEGWNDNLIYMVVSRSAPVRRCDMASCLDAWASSQSPGCPQWLTSWSVFLEVAAPALSSRLSWSIDLAAQIRGWSHRSWLLSRAHSSAPRPRWRYTLETGAVELQTDPFQIHLDLKCLTAIEVEEFIYP